MEAEEKSGNADEERAVVPKRRQWVPLLQDFEDDSGSRKRLSGTRPFPDGPGRGNRAVQELPCASDGRGERFAPGEAGGDGGREDAPRPVKWSPRDPVAFENLEPLFVEENVHDLGRLALLPGRQVPALDENGPRPVSRRASAASFMLSIPSTATPVNAWTSGTFGVMIVARGNRSRLSGLIPFSGNSGVPGRI